MTQDTKQSIQPSLMQLRIPYAVKPIQPNPALPASTRQPNNSAVTLGQTTETKTSASIEENTIDEQPFLIHVTVFSDDIKKKVALTKEYLVAVEDVLYCLDKNAFSYQEKILNYCKIANIIQNIFTSHGKTKTMVSWFSLARILKKSFENKSKIGFKTVVKHDAKTCQRWRFFKKALFSLTNKTNIFSTAEIDLDKRTFKVIQDHSIASSVDFSTVVQTTGQKTTEETKRSRPAKKAASSPDQVTCIPKPTVSVENLYEITYFPFTFEGNTLTLPIFEDIAKKYYIEASKIRDYTFIEPNIKLSAIIKKIAKLLKEKSAAEMRSLGSGKPNLIPLIAFVDLDIADTEEPVARYHKVIKAAYKQFSKKKVRFSLPPENFRSTKKAKCLTASGSVAAQTLETKSITPHDALAASSSTYAALNPLLTAPHPLPQSAIANELPLPNQIDNQNVAASAFPFRSASPKYFSSQITPASLPHELPISSSRDLPTSSSHNLPKSSSHDLIVGPRKE